MIYFGFDLGDGESCVAWSRDIAAAEPMPLPIAGDLSFITAVAMLGDEPVIGRLASAENPDLRELQVCFKRHFLENRPEIDLAIRRFATGVMNALRQHEAVRDVVDDPEKACFIVGCPAGWKEGARARYRQLLTEAGMPNVRLASESRAAFENALRRRIPGVDAKMIEDCVLMIDIGSSTLDLAYVCDGQEHNVEIVGDVKLGGGLMDEMIVEYALSSTGNPLTESLLRRFLENNPAWHSRVMLEARALKERYFRKEEQYFSSGETLEKFIRIPGIPTVRGLTIRLSPEIMQFSIISQPHPLLDGMSFESRLLTTLRSVHQRIRQREPRLVILTGGPSRMRFFREMCQEEFSESTVIVSSEPEFDIARGLAYAGSVDEGAARLLRELREYIASDAVETLVANSMSDLLQNISDALGEKLMTRCALPSFCLWRKGQLESLQDFEHKTGEAVAAYLKSADGQQAVENACKPWTRTLMSQVQTALDDIARKHGISLGQLQAGRIRLGGGEDEVTGLDVASQLIAAVQTLITVITGVVMAMLCGGAGVALISTGVGGMVGGAVIAAAAGFLGRDFVKSAVMKANLPVLMRKLIPDSAVGGARNQRRIAESLCQALAADANFTADLSDQITSLIDEDLDGLLRSSEVQFVA
nr:hypothetical protein [Clostridia bacterium]